MEFQNYINLVEKKEDTAPTKTAVFTFGRFQPPTKGHEKLVNKVIEEATKRSADPLVFPSRTVDTNKKPEKRVNPLDFKTKVAFMKHALPKVKIVDEEAVKSPWHVLEYLDEQGYTDVVIVVGSDRVPEFTERMGKYTEDAFRSFQVVSAGERDPDADGVSRMSSTAAREAAREGNIGKFRVATGWAGTEVEALMNAVKRGLEGE